MTGLDEKETPGGGPPSRRRRLRDPATALIAAAVLLPALLFALAAWQGHRDALHQAEIRAERTARVLEEHASKVFETHRLVIQQVNERIRAIDWTRADQRDDLCDLLKKLQAELPQIATITIVDREGRLRVSSRGDAQAAGLSFADRDWFQALKAADLPLPYVSRAYLGRQSGIAIFNIAGRTTPRSGNAFDGAITVSVNRNYFEHFYQSVEPSFDHSVLLVRDDAQVLARVPGPTRDALPLYSAMRERMRHGAVGTYVGSTRMDGNERIFAYRKVGDYPVYVRFGITKHATLAPWRQSLLTYGLVATLASLALFGVSILALRQTDRERLARRRWQETAAALREEAAQRSRIEDQLRQSQKMEAVGRLTGGVAHDFNNLLTAVIGSLDLVRRRKDKVDAQTLDLVGNALEGAHRAAALTSRLMAFSRRQPLRAARIDANALVAGMSELLRRTLGETITIRTVLTDGLWPLSSDPNQLESAILNLAVNARDAMPDGGTLRIETANAADVMDAAADKLDLTPRDYVAITVTDTGTGMPADVLAHVFEPFFTTKATGRGTGLGLSQVYGFVKQSGGHVSVESEIGRGTTFRILLPRVEGVVAPVAETQPTRQPHSEPSRRGHGETILVVEDEPMVLRLSSSILMEAGYRVVTARDGRSALDRFQREGEIALLFTDVVLVGGMNGRVLAEAILRQKPDLPVLYTSGYTGDALVRDGRLEAGIDLLAKPFAAEALVDRVATLIADARRSEAQLVAL